MGGRLTSQIIALLCLGASACGQQSTNVVATNLLLRRPLELSPAAVRLNQSPYFKSEIDDFRRVREHSLVANFIESDLEPSVSLGAVVEYPERGPAAHWLWFCSHSSLDKWPDLSTNRLKIIIDGVTTVDTEPDPKRWSVDKTKSGDIVDGAYYQASAEVLRALGSARRAQLRIEGEKRVVQRELSVTNIARFKVFVETFMDGKPASKSGLSEGTKDGVPISVWNEFADAAKKDWPKDPHMQDWALKHSIEAWKKLNR